MTVLRKLFVFGGLIFLILAIVAWQTPAAWIAKFSNLPEKGISYGRMTGTFWKGEAFQVKYRDLMLGDMKWDFKTFNQAHPLKTTWAIDAKGIDYNLNMFVDTEGRQAQDLRLVQGQIPAGWVDLSEIAQFVFLTGTFDLDLDHASATGNLSNLAKGTIYWKNAGLSGLVDESMGTVIIEIQGDNRFTSADFTPDPEADLKLDGEIRLNRNQYFTELTLTATEEKQYVIEMLSDLGTINEDGSLDIDKSGRMPR
jgi:hypothetical protein